jgi:hypothetical protein
MMPVFTCSGPDCPRLISVSSVPGGNPAALADPEGFAVEYLQCRACKKYFCDRSLVKLGTSMTETSCPGCKGPLFNPNSAGIATQPATAQPATAQMFQKTKIVVTGTSLLFPNICVCCGGPSDTTFKINGYSTTYSGRTRTSRTTTWPISSCTKCSPHIDAASFENHTKTIGEDQIKLPFKDRMSVIVGPLALGFLAFVMVKDGPLRREIPEALRYPFVAFAAFVGFLIYQGIASRKLGKKQREALEQNVRAKNEAERNAKGKASLGPTCCRSEKGANCIDYVLSSNGSHSFTFYRKDFADIFARLNQANTVSIEKFNS